MSCKCNEYADELKTFADVVKRCEYSAQIEPTLEIIITDDTGWTSVLRCRICGKLWAKEYPFSETHGGGPVCLYQIAIVDPIQWLASEPELTMHIRREHENRDYLASLGEEIGPELCRRSGCTRKRISLSVMCSLHHFEMVTVAGAATRVTGG